MSGYVTTPVNTCEAVPVPNAPGTMKDVMNDTNAALERVSHTLDVLWSFVAEPGMNTDTPPRTKCECLMGSVVDASEIANEIMAKAERLCKVLGV